MCILFPSENTEIATLNAATRAMILAGHKDAKKRVLLFFSVYFITGAMSKWCFTQISLNVTRYVAHSICIWTAVHNFILYWQAIQWKTLPQEI